MEEGNFASFKTLTTYLQKYNYYQTLTTHLQKYSYYMWFFNKCLRTFVSIFRFF